MDIITLRNVGSFEIPDTFRSILRISPNKGVDDPSELFITKDKEIKLSTSEGTILPLTFIPKVAQCEVVNRDKDSVELINIVHNYNKLFIAKSLNIRPTLYIKPSNRQVPLLFVNDGNSLGYPVQAPADTNYFNYERNISDGVNMVALNPNLSMEENISKLTDEEYELLLSLEKTKKISINNKPIYRYLKGAGKFFQDLNYCTSVLGVYPGDTYKQNNDKDKIYDLNDNHHKNNNKLHTQLSYIPLDSLIWKCVEAYLAGKYRSYKGHYFNLNKKTSDELGKKLFSDNITELDIKDKAPIINAFVQSGTIHYNAIPAHRYFYHLKRRLVGQPTKAELGNSSAMNMLCTQYILCDGKEFKESYKQLADIPEIDWTETHEAIAKSTNKKNGSGEVDSSAFKTPPLFELNQYAPRFLRGLNWIRNGEKSFKANTLKYKKIDRNEDPANHAKDIGEVGTYYANYDADLQRKYEHGHAQFAAKTFVGEITSLNEEIDIFRGAHSSSEIPTNNEAWEKYIKGQSDTFLGSQMLKTVGGLKKSGITIENFKEIQNAPITVSGDTHEYFYSIKACIKYGKSEHGGCHNHKTPCHSKFKVRDGGYMLARNEDNKWFQSGKTWKKAHNVWRLTSSLPIQNKYGTPDVLSENKLSSIKCGNEPTYIDDSLPTPPAVNFIPLMKI